MCDLDFSSPRSTSPSSQAPPPTSAPTSPTGPTTQPTKPTSPTTAPTGTPTAPPAAGNPFVGYSVYLSPYYASEVAAAAATITDATLKSKASSVANIPTFIWFDQVSKVPTLGTYLADAESVQKSTGQKQIVPIVVYDLPDRDCAAAASNGEFSIANGGQAKYFDYIDQLVTQIQGMLHFLSSKKSLTPGRFQRTPMFASLL